MLRFRSRVLRFRDLGASFSSFGCFVLRSSFSSASFSKLPLACTICNHPTTTKAEENTNKRVHGVPLANSQAPTANPSTSHRRTNRPPRSYGFVTIQRPQRPKEIQNKRIHGVPPATSQTPNASSLTSHAE